MSIRKKALFIFLLGISGIWGYRWFAGLGGHNPFDQNLPANPVDDTLYEAFLKAVLRSDGLDYQAALQNRQLLDGYLNEIARTKPGNLNKDERLAYLLNAYNAMVIRGVLDVWPIESIEEVGPFHAFFRQRNYEIAGQKVSLHGLETQWIQPLTPYIHFGLNCASQSCPSLNEEPFHASQVQEQLKSQARAFLSNSKLNHRRGDVWFLSEIFAWYEEDFGGQKGVIAFVQKHTQWPGPKEILYLPYDWGLNQATAPADNSPKP